MRDVREEGGVGREGVREEEGEGSEGRGKGGCEGGCFETL